MSSTSSDLYIRFETADEKESPPLEGECLDEMHPGNPKIPHPDKIDGVKVNPGWFQFTSLRFHYSVKDHSETQSEKDEREAAALKAKALIAQGKTPPKPLKSSDSSERRIQVYKRVDRTTTVMWESYCYTGKTFKRVEVEACRTGGLPNAPKIPFVRLVFEGNIKIMAVSMDLQVDALPVETVTFSYDRVRIESIWTDNETGKRCVSKPRSFGWDFTINDQKGGEWK